MNTVAYHVSEKDWVHMPIVADVYAKILEANDEVVAEIVLNPEFHGHEDWEAEAAWLAEHFQNIPLMVDVAGGWMHQTTPAELTALKAQPDMDIRWIRFSEFVSWCLHLQIEFPVDYVNGLFDWCQSNNVKVYWCEWKVDFALGTEWEVRTFDLVKELIEDYKELVVVGFKTNSGDLEPAAGYKYLADVGFEHIGATVESWYWETRHRTHIWEPTEGLENPDNMPVSWMVRHVKEAQAAGVELIQFEPYWYFFEHKTGKPRDSLNFIHNFIGSHLAGMAASTVILQTLKAEWLHSKNYEQSISFVPTKEDVAWLDGRASTVVGWDIQPSAFDFKKILKKYAISCYSLGSGSPSGKLWLRTETVAVELLVKTLGSTLEKAARARDSMLVEVERILHMYSKVAPLWDVNPGPTGVYKHRRIPGFRDVVVSQELNHVDDESFARVTLQVVCRPNRISWVTK